MSVSWMRVFALCCFTTAALPAAEVIEDFHSRVEVAADGSLRVTETIRVVCEQQAIRHGIYRDFPTLYRGDWGLRKSVGFRVISVIRDDAGEPWHSEPKNNGLRIYIGSSSKDVPPGIHTYQLTYATDRQLGFFEHHDELYWNVTGNGWTFPIQHASCDVVLPEGTRVLSVEGYTGPKGSKARDCKAEPGVEASNTAQIETTKALGTQEGLTVVVTFPKGFVHPPDGKTGFKALMRDNKGLFLGLAGLLLVLLYYTSVWAAFGKDPARGTIVPLYEPPKGFSPAAVRMLVRMGYDDKATAANIIDMAVKGAITIHRGDSRITIKRKDGAPPLLLPDERGMFNAYLSTSQLTFEPSSHKRVAAGRDVLKEYLSRSLEKVYFVRNLKPWCIGILFSAVPALVSLSNARDLGGAVFMILWLSIWSLGVTVLISGVVSSFRRGAVASGIFMSLFATPFVIGEIVGLIGLITMATPWVAGIFVAGGLMNGIFYHLMKAPTFAGRRLLDQIEGFKRYLEVAEKDRLNFQHPPERTPELFDKFLPYAFALDVDQAWAAQFADVLKTAGRLNENGAYDPVWYSGRAFTGAGIAGFTHDLGGSISNAISSSSSPPGTSSGSSSGGGGGGSSGGGGGGGGGGGW